MNSIKILSDRKASTALPAAVAKLVLGVIVVAVMLLVFAGFSSPFLDRMSNQESLNSFGKFTAGLSTACDRGISTQTYISFSETGSQKYVISAVGKETAAYLREQSDDLVDKESKSNVKKCLDDNCYCLLKISNDKLKINNNQKAIVKEVVGDSQEISYSKNSVGGATYYKGSKETDKLQLAQSFTPGQSCKNPELWIRAGVENLNSFLNTDIVTVKLSYAKADGTPYEDYVFSTLKKSDFQNSKDGWIKLGLEQFFLDKNRRYVLTLSSANDLSGAAFYWNGSDDFSDLNSWNSAVEARGIYSSSGGENAGWNTHSGYRYDFKVVMDSVNQPIAENVKTENLGFFEFTGKINPAQAFVPVREGMLDSISIHAKLSTPTVSFNTPVYLSLYASKQSKESSPSLIPDTSKLLAKEKLPFDKLRSGAEWLTVNFAEPVYVSEWGTYFIVLSSDSELAIPLRWYASTGGSETYSQYFGVGHALRDNDAETGISTDNEWFVMDQVKSSSGTLCTATLYSDINYGGRYLTLTGESGSIHFKDKISSMKIKSGCYVGVCTNVGFSGTCGNFNTEYVSTTHENYKDSISSLRVQSDSMCTATVYADVNYYGEYMTVTGSSDSTHFYEDVGTVLPDWKNVASSLKITSGCSVEVCKDEDFLDRVAGTCKTFSSNIANLGDYSLNDVISSVRINSAFGFNVTASSLDTEGLLDKWDSELKKAFDPDIKNLGGIDVVQCRNIVNDLNCVGDDFHALAPMIETNKKTYVITWLQPNGKTLWFDSYSFDRPVSSGGVFENRILSHTEPELYDYLTITSQEEAPIYG